MDMDFREMLPLLRQIRRELHQIPEIGLQEYQTSAYIRRKLAEFGITETEQWLDTGVVAVIHGKQDAPAVAFRADMDALPVTEQTGCTFVSRREGYMHACGHDGHMTILLGFAKYLQEHREDLRGDVVLIFQPENGEFYTSPVNRGGNDVV